MEINKKYIRLPNPVPIMISARVSQSHYNWFKKNNINVSAFIRAKVEEMDNYEEETEEEE